MPLPIKSGGYCEPPSSRCFKMIIDDLNTGSVPCIVRRMRTIRRGFVVTLTTAVCLMIAAGPASAQVAAGEITGLVKDQAGAAVPGAMVTVTEVATNRQRVVTSSADGIYTAASLPPGAYRLDVELQGFKPIRREGVHLATGEK